MFRGISDGLRWWGDGELEVGGRGGSGVDAAVAVVVGGSEGAGCWARREKNENMVVAGGSVSESLRSSSY